MGYEGLTRAMCELREGKEWNVVYENGYAFFSRSQNAEFCLTSKDAYRVIKDNPQIRFHYSKSHRKAVNPFAKLI